MKHTDQTQTVAEAVAAGAQRLESAGIGAAQARIASRVLLLDAVGISREELRLRPGRPISADEALRFETLLARREQREPLAYILGWREFYGLPFIVTPAVLVPRQETEHVVDAVLEALEGVDSPSIADIGCGAGSIGVALAAQRPDAQVYASDISKEALEIAEENARRNNVSGRTKFVHGDLVAPLVEFGPFDAIASNPPYIPAADIASLEPEVSDWEPRMALGTDADALTVYRRLVAESVPALRPGGSLTVEVGMGQATRVAEIWSEAGLVDVTVVPDYAGIGRVVTGRAPRSRPV